MLLLAFTVAAAAAALQQSAAIRDTQTLMNAAAGNDVVVAQSSPSGRPCRRHIPGFAPLLPILPDPVPAAPLPSPAPPGPAGPAECLPSLKRLAPCMDYLSTVATASAPSRSCCHRFQSVVDKAPICLCHAINGDINDINSDVFTNPIDLARMMSLPAACGVALPMETLAKCSSE
ncbi:hypothetical protein ABZP36_001564 [Zizania latifolia]